MDNNKLNTQFFNSFSFYLYYFVAVVVSLMKYYNMKEDLLLKFLTISMDFYVIINRKGSAVILFYMFLLYIVFNFFFGKFLLIFIYPLILLILVFTLILWTFYMASAYLVIFMKDGLGFNLKKSVWPSKCVR